MQFLKKRLEIFNLNREIHALNREISMLNAPTYAGGLVFNPAASNPVRYRESERDHLMREYMNTLVQKRSELV